MLSLEKLTVTDFGPYRGRQELRFSREHGVYLIYGPNGRGKTNLHNAFRYALYGYVLDRRGRVGKLEKIANTEAKKSQGYGSFETVLDFHDDGARYRLTRRYDESQTPRELLLLERDGVPFAQDESQRILSQIAPQSVSQFFLFDGEQLRQYEALLDLESEEGAALEQAIERVLGIPIVDYAKADVTQIGRGAEKQLAEQYAAHDETKRLGNALKEAQDVRERMLESQTQVGDKIEETKARVEELEAQLREQQKSERLLGQLDELRAKDADLELKQKAAVEAIGEVAGSLWKAVLATSARDRLVEAERRVELAEQAQRESSAAVRDLAHLQHEADCPVCHHDVSEELRRDLIERLERLVSDDHHQTVQAALQAARGRERVLRKLASEDPRLIADRDKALRNIRLERTEAYEDIVRIEGDLAEIGEDKLRSLTNERTERTEQIARDKQRFEDGARKLADQELAIEALKTKLKTASFKADPNVQRKDQVSKALADLFAAAIDAYRDKLRQRVEQEASTIFKRLTDEPDYVGLRITDHYGLEIIDTDGEVVQRSAGFEHLVALSLMAALQDSAAVRGPVVMDYPFGRLDASNTSRVVAALPRMARQVVLLSFDGEFDRPAALKALGADLVAEYELERVTSKHTRLEPRRTV